MIYYFAYGSNLDPGRIKSRCPDNQFKAVAVLREYRICFPRHSKGNAGGVASITESPGGEVHGAVYFLSVDDLESLDGYEGYVSGGDRNAYERVEVDVVIGGDQILRCVTYIANCDHAKFHKPSDEYLSRVVDGLTLLIGHGIPQSYIQTVKFAAENR
ncbi:MAG: gamma-glutamylcyclotransferase family protein [Bdellovibrio sp.]